MGRRVVGGSGGAAAAAGAGEPVGAEAGVGLGTGGVKGTSLLLCSWLRWRPETLAEVQVLDSGLSFVGTPEGKKERRTSELHLRTTSSLRSRGLRWPVRHIFD